MICLNMIVKDESDNIIRTLMNLWSYIKFSYYVICDTGSSDDTKELIKSFFDGKCDGEIHDDEWEDFGTNRTKALERAFDKTDYVLIFDADDKIMGDFQLPKLDKDKYMLNIGSGFTYQRPLLINNRKKWKFVGVLHEYLEEQFQPCSTGTIPYNYHIMSGRTGNRNKNPNKYIDDANILKKAFEHEEDVKLKCRYAFYCAQSFRDARKKDEAIEWYKLVLTLQNWNQEKYLAMINLGHLTTEVKYYLDAIHFDPERIEGIVYAMQHFRLAGCHLIVNFLYHKYKNYSKPDGKLFLDTCVYDNMDFEFNNSISSYYTDDKQSGYECCLKLLENHQYEELSLNNKKCYEKILSL